MSWLTIKKGILWFDLWWRNAYVLHFLSCFFIVSPFIVFLKMGIIGSLIISIFFGFGKELGDKLIKKGPFEILKAFVTTIGGILFYFIYNS